jgi:hypothetical protein
LSVVGVGVIVRLTVGGVNGGAPAEGTGLSGRLADSVNDFPCFGPKSAGENARIQGRVGRQNGGARQMGALSAVKAEKPLNLLGPRHIPSLE